MSDCVIGVLGCTGGVGGAAARQLAAWRLGELRLGARNRDRVRPLLAETGGACVAAEVDVADEAALARFSDGCRVVVNCAGPSTWIRDRAARAALTAGADYVDAGGDDPVRALLEAADLPAARTAVLSAGVMPGLSGLLPRTLAAQGFDEVTGLVAYVGGLDRFTPSAAADYLASLDNGHGESRAAWRSGAFVPRALGPLEDVELPFFTGRVTAHPYLSTETQRMARSLGLAQCDWYHVFAGTRFLQAVHRLRAVPAAGPDAAAAVGELARAAAVDTAGRDRYQLFVLRMEGRARGGPAVRTLVLRTADGSLLTGQVTALVTASLLAGELAPGVHFAAEALDPVEALAGVGSLPAVRTLEVFESAPDGAAIEEGAL